LFAEDEVETIDTTGGKNTWMVAVVAVDIGWDVELESAGT
jgi:hypothetical protein